VSPIAPERGSTDDRVVGTLLGMAAGDALGAGYEFGTPPDGPAEMIGGGLGHWAPGEWTDDTQMAICIAEVTAAGPIDLVAIGQRFLDWYDTRPPDVGVQTASVLGSADDATELTSCAADHYARYPQRSAGNGSLMRTAPVALTYLGNDGAIAHWARQVSGLTHADPLAADACVLWCVAIDRAVREQRLDGARDGLALLDGPARERWSQALDEAEAAPAESFTPNGFVVTALQAAHAAVHQTPVPDDEPGRHLHDALQTAVGIGNDTDTVAAIAGALLGARWGASSVPATWRQLLHGWPGYHADDLTRLALAIST
jgi:ADP-ribosylglycohydrolase